MDASNDLVISVVKGMYKWSDFEPFVVSLERTGFKGRKVMVIWGGSTQVRENLIRHGFTLVDFTSRRSSYGSFCTERFEPALGAIRSLLPDLRYMVWSDWRDVVFQTNPSSWLERNLGESKIIGCSECVKIQDEHYNRQWVREAAGCVAYETVKHEEILCAGTLAGEANALYSALYKMYEILDETPSKIDQGVLNWVLRITPFKEITRVPRMSEGFCASCNWFLIPGEFTGAGEGAWTDDKPQLTSSGTVCPKGSDQPFCIVHQYDRDARWKTVISGKYYDAQSIDCI